MPTIRSQQDRAEWAAIQLRSDETTRVDSLPVEINPESLKVSYTNQVKKVGSQGGSVQFLGAGASKMTVQLIFDTSEADPGAEGVLLSLEKLRSWMGKDVVETTDEEAAALAHMSDKAKAETAVATAQRKAAEDDLARLQSEAGAIDAPGKGDAQSKAKKAEHEAQKKAAQEAKEAAEKSRSDLIKAAPPGRPIPLVAFVWGAFTFVGIIESLEQTLELFSSQGVPLRASVQLTLARQRLVSSLTPAKPRSPDAGPPTGTAPLIPTPPGLTAQTLGAALGGGGGGGWQSPARALGIENPRQLPTGAWMDPRKLTGG